jgi:hypothetical protein
MVLFKAEVEITTTTSAGKSPRSAAALSRFHSEAVSGQRGNVSKNSGKRLPDSFTSAEFRMYSCATVIKIQIDDISRPFVMRFLP